ncbi:MAG: hypothetical protein V1781_05100 [Bacteroidota bacterium]
MKKFFVMSLMMPLFVMAQEKPVAEAQPVAQEKPVIPEKPKWYDEVKLYGFLQGNMIYVTNSVYSWANPANNYLSTPQFAVADSIGYPALGFTAQHSRLDLDISKGTDIKVGGKLEVDFYGGQHDVNVKTRLRLGYAFLSKGGFETRIGQQWDLFSPLNPTTNNTNANMWYTGNMGFRRGQIQLIYKKADDVFAPMIQISAGEASKEDQLTAVTLGDDNKSCTPMLQGRVSAKILKKYEIGMYYANASFKKRYGPSKIDTTKNFSTNGFGADITLPLHKYFEVKAEFNLGTNLANANFFAVSGGTVLDPKTNKFIDKKDMGMWFNITSKISDHFNMIIGYGTNQNKTAEKYLEKSNVISNATIYGDLVFPISNGFSIAIEVQNIATKVVDQMDNTTPTEPTIKKERINSATIINLAGKIIF